MVISDRKTQFGLAFQPIPYPLVLNLKIILVKNRLDRVENKTVIVTLSGKAEDYGEQQMKYYNDDNINFYFFSLFNKIDKIYSFHNLQILFFL